MQNIISKSITEMEMSLTLPPKCRAVIIAHGNEYGIQLGKNMIAWEKFGLMLEASPIKTFYLASCYSERVKPYTLKQVFGFQGEIDAYVAGIDISKQIAQAQDQENSLNYRQIIAQENSVIYESRKISIKQALFRVYAAVLIVLIYNKTR